MNNKGSTTIFMLIIMSGIIGFALIMINNIHHVSFVNVLKNNLYLSMDNVFSDYDNYIYENYGILSVTRENLDEKVQGELEVNMSIDTNKVHRFLDVNLSIPATKSISDSWSLNYQINNYMEYRVLGEVYDRFLQMKNKEERINKEFEETKPIMEDISKAVVSIDKYINDSLNENIYAYNRLLENVDFEDLDDDIDYFEDLGRLKKNLSKKEFRLAISRSSKKTQKYYKKYKSFVDFVDDGYKLSKEIKESVGKINKKLDSLSKNINKILDLEDSSSYRDALKSMSIGAIRYSEYYPDDIKGMEANKAFIKNIQEKIIEKVDEGNKTLEKMQNSYSYYRFPDRFEDDLEDLEDLLQLEQLEKRSTDKGLSRKYRDLLSKTITAAYGTDIVIEGKLLNNLPSKKTSITSGNSQSIYYSNSVINRRYEEVSRLLKEKNTIESMKETVINNKTDDYQGSGFMDNIRTTEYIIQSFRDISKNEEYDFFDKYNRSSYFENSEIEYIISGDKSSKWNINKVKCLIIMSRTPLNAYHIYSDNIKYSLCNDIGLAIGSIWGGGPFITHGLVISWAIVESSEDYRCMINGESVPLLKDRESWKTDFISNGKETVNNPYSQYDVFTENFIDMSLMDEVTEEDMIKYLDNTLDDKNAKKSFLDEYKKIKTSKKSDKNLVKQIDKSKKAMYSKLKKNKNILKVGKILNIDLFYQDYLRLLIMAQDKETRIGRIKDLIFLNLYSEYNTIIDLDDYITEMTVIVSGKHKSRFLDTSKNIEVEVIRGY